MIRTYRQSEIKAFMTCPREWYLKYHLGLVRAAGPEPDLGVRDIGTLVHGALEELYRGGDPMDYIDCTESNLPEDIRQAYAETYKFGRRMIEGYVDWLAETGADAGWQVVNVERQVEVPFDTILGDEVVITGKMDLEILDPWGLPKIVDNKSVQTFEQASMLFLDFQGRTYSLLRRLEGQPAEGFIHNQLRRVLRTGTAKPPFYNRVDVRYNDTVLDNHHRQLKKTLSDMVSAARLLEDGYDHQVIVPPVESKDCTWRCDFLPACMMMDDGSDYQGYLGEFYTPVSINQKGTE